MKKVIKVFFIIMILFVGSPVWADTTVYLDIKTPTSTLYDQDITVTPCDSDNDNATPEIATAYCAILQSGIQNDWNWAWAPGAFLNSLGNIAGYTSQDKDNHDVYHYWSWSLNGTEGTTGLNQYELQPSDLILLDFIDPAPEPTPSTGSASCCSADFPLSVANTAIPTFSIKPIFDLKKAFDFLNAQQKENGSFGEDLYTDWTALALASGNSQDQTIKLIKYFGEAKIFGSLLTDYERHAMAIMAIGLNPYNTNGENYIKKITSSFDGKQFGNINEDNDDIFALIVLQNAGFIQTDKIINDDINFILSKQKDDGSWDESVDMTGATLEALAIFSTIPGVGESLEKAKEFLRQNQKDNGGWNNVSSTAWGLEGIVALGGKPENWIKNGNTPLDYLATRQDIDGGIKGEYLQNRIWETAYVVSALSGKTWNQIMQKFEKPEIPTEIKIAVKSPKKIIKKETLTATTINTIAPSSAPTQTEVPKKNWFRNLLDKIFSIF